MARRAGPGRGERILAGIRAQQRDQLRNVLRRNRGIDDQHVRIDREQADRREILQRIVGDFLHVGADRDRSARARQQGVSVRGLFGCELRADRPACTGLVVHDERLPEHGYELFRHHPRGEVGRLSRRPGDDDPDRVVGIALRKSTAHAGERKQHGEANGIFHWSSCSGSGAGWNGSVTGRLGALQPDIIRPER